jgi:hypothetical protein
LIDAYMSEGDCPLNPGMTMRDSTTVQLIAFAAFIAGTVIIVTILLAFIAGQCALGTPTLPAIFPCFTGS